MERLNRDWQDENPSSSEFFVHFRVAWRGLVPGVIRFLRGHGKEGAERSVSGQGSRFTLAPLAPQHCNLVFRRNVGGFQGLYRLPGGRGGRG